MALNTDLAVESFRELSHAGELSGVVTDEYYDSDASATVSRTEI